MRKKEKKIRKMSFIFLVIVTFAGLTTIVVNYYTIRILSASRAYINGESQYSKGQKEASQHLISYIATENHIDYTLFLQAINIPIGDRIARENLSSGLKRDNIAYAAFLQGKNHPDDIEDIIWLFKTFQHISFFEDIVKIWQKGDGLVEVLRQKGLTVHHKLMSGSPNAAEKNKLITDINNISSQLTIMQQNFSDRLGVICRQINFLVYLVNVIVTLLIICSIILFVWRSLRNMHTSYNKIIEQNDSLQTLNSELDKVIHNVSHDLRSPLAALTGLISLIDDEGDIEQIRLYTSLMQKSIDKQGEFINEILHSAKHKPDAKDSNECNLSEIIDDVLSQNSYSSDGKKLHFEKEIQVQRVNCDDVKLKTILNNLISNAIKYSDANKIQNWIKIKTFRINSFCVIEVEDNGVGIKKQDEEQIFNKFFTIKQNRDSNGIGLYLTKDAVEQIHGTIKVTSNHMVGTKFIIELPYA